jgi:hypothetical protein
VELVVEWRVRRDGCGRAAGWPATPAVEVDAEGGRPLAPGGGLLLRRVSAPSRWRGCGCSTPNGVCDCSCGRCAAPVLLPVGRTDQAPRAAQPVLRKAL